MKDMAAPLLRQALLVVGGGGGSPKARSRRGANRDSLGSVPAQHKQGSSLGGLLLAGSSSRHRFAIGGGSFFWRAPAFAVNSVYSCACVCAARLPAVLASSQKGVVLVVGLAKWRK